MKFGILIKNRRISILRQDPKRDAFLEFEDFSNYGTNGEQHEKSQYDYYSHLRLPHHFFELVILAVRYT